jgi:hypothetical protein
LLQIRRPKQASTGCLTLVWDRIVSDHPASACITLFIAKVASTMPPKPNPYGAAEAGMFKSWLSRSSSLNSPRLFSQSTDPLPPGSSGALSPRQSTPPLVVDLTNEADQLEPSTIAGCRHEADTHTGIVQRCLP